MSEVYRDEVPAHLRTTAQLRSSGRRPVDPSKATAWLERVFDGDVWRTALHDVTATAPLPPSPPRAPGPARATTSPAREESATWARDVLADRDAVVLDTELTDFTGRVIEVAVVATDGATLLTSLVDPEGTPINPHAQRAHGITAQMLAGAPTLEQLWPKLDHVLRGKRVIAWNAPFDLTRLRAEHRHIFGDADLPDWLTGPWLCAMRKHAAWVGDRNTKSGGFRNHRLEGGHRAEGDCLAALAWIKRMADTAPGAAAHASAEAHPDAVTTGAPTPDLATPDLATIRELWPQVLGKVREHSRSLEAMLGKAEPVLASGRVLTIRHPAAVVGRRVAQSQNLDLVNTALTAVLGQPWTARVAPHDPTA
ncbi:3'-5' exonuclease [Actinosynnema pretiosum]|uniref:3'-5' exonuclease n=1 Tax=Actinosynnema pretiosum TaxID=42197 RepID=UPI0015A582FF|nr:3'-5' exonuclease [Actinosynnema pretiosum]